MENVKINNISKGILKRIKTERSITEEQIYALFDGIVEVMEKGGDFEDASEAAQLLERMNDVWMYQKFKSSSASEDFLYGSIWGSMSILSSFWKKKKEQQDCRLLVQKYKDDTSCLFLNAILKKPGIKNSALAQICYVTPSRISQMTQVAMEDGLITSQKVGREKYYYLKTKGNDVYKAILEEKKPVYKGKRNYSMIVLNNQMEDAGLKFRMLTEMLGSDPDKCLIGVAVAFQEKEHRINVGREGSKGICKSEIKYLSNNYTNSWDLLKEINLTKQLSYMD